MPNTIENNNISTDPNQLMMSQFLGASKEIPLKLKITSLKRRGRGNDNKEVNFAFCKLTLHANGTYNLQSGTLYDANVGMSPHYGQWLEEGDVSQYEIKSTVSIKQPNRLKQLIHPSQWTSLDSAPVFYIKHYSKTLLNHIFDIRFRKKGTTTLLNTHLTLVMWTVNNN